MKKPRRLARRIVESVKHRVGAYDKGEQELAFWVESWDRQLREGTLWGVGTLEFAGDDAVASDYIGRRWQQARAEVARVLEEAQIDDREFFAGRVVLDIGPGCVGFPDAVAEQAKLSFGLDPIADDYHRAGLLIPDSKAIYLHSGAESIPLLTDSVDVVVCRNALDHVVKPTVVLGEIARVLAPSGKLILNVDLDHAPGPTEPHEISHKRLKSWLKNWTIDHEVVGGSHAAGLGDSAVLVATPPSS